MWVKTTGREGDDGRWAHDPGSTNQRPSLPLVKVTASAMSMWSKPDQWELVPRLWLGLLGKRRYPFTGAAEGWDQAWNCWRKGGLGAGERAEALVTLFDSLDLATTETRPPWLWLAN